MSLYLPVKFNATRYSTSSMTYDKDTFLKTEISIFRIWGILLCMVFCPIMFTPLEVVSEWVTERVLREDKTHITGLKLVTQISWCQMNSEEKNNKLVKKFNVTSWKMACFDRFFWSIFRSSVFTSVLFLLIQIMLPLYFR